MKRLLDWRLLTALLVFAFGMTVASCGEDDEVKPDTEQGTDGSTDGGEVDLTNPDGGVAVDLGLLSGTLWADRNIGALKPEASGYHFAWGETERKAVYDWSTYKWCDGSYDTQTKYCTDRYYGLNGFTDNKTTLAPEDDAATANWGKGWCMPTKAEIEELINDCIWTWSTQNGVNGYKVTGPNGNSIFLPAAGYRRSDNLSYAGSFGYYWSSSLCGSDPHYAWYLFFDSSYHRLSYSYGRCSGHTVRAVCAEN